MSGSHTAGRQAHREVSAGGVVYRWRDGQPLVLLIHDTYRHWGLPKGHLELDETPEAAAFREVQEETGLSDLRMGPLLQTIDWYFESARGLVHKHCHFYLVEAPTGDPVPQIEEGITSCCWLSISQALERISYPNAREVIRGAATLLGLPTDRDAVREPPPQTAG
jgi:8-oxo-dGTP pyrophosphatase MutT (NUDIX family)